MLRDPPRRKRPKNRRKLSTSHFQSEVGEVFGEIGGELPAKFGRRFSTFFWWGKSSEAFSTKTPLQISPSNFTTRFRVVAGPRKLLGERQVTVLGGTVLKFSGPTLFSTKNLLRLFLGNSLARQKIISKNKQNSRGYSYACFKGYFWRVFRNNLRNKNLVARYSAILRYYSCYTPL